MVENPMLHIVPVALDKTAFNIEAIKSLNYIREYEYEKINNSSFLFQWLMKSIE